MDQKTLIAGVISLTLSIILVGSILVPIVQDVQTTAGNEITKTNESLVSDLSGYYDEDVTLTITSEVGTTAMTDGSITVNDYEVPLTDHSITLPFLFSKVAYLQMSASNGTSSMGIYRFYGDSAVTGNFEFGHTYVLTYDNTAKTISMTDTNLSTDVTSTVVEDYSAEYFFGLKEDGNYSLTRQTAFSGSTSFENMYITMDAIEDQTAGVFRESKSITVGSVSVGVVVVASQYGIESWTSVDGYSVDVDIAVNGLSLADGTTDIYTGGTPVLTITVTNDDTSESTTETITPEVSWVLHEVSGHASSGAAYSLYGVIPVIVIIAIVMMAAGMIYSKRD